MWGNEQGALASFGQNGSDDLLCAAREDPSGTIGKVQADCRSLSTDPGQCWAPPETPAKCPRRYSSAGQLSNASRHPALELSGHGASGHLNLRWRRERSEGCHTLVGLSARSCRLHSGGVQAHEPTGRYSPSSIASVSSASRDETTQGDTGRSRLVGLPTGRRSRMPLTRLRPGWAHRSGYGRPSRS